MIACVWVFIYGIILSTVNSEFGIPPQHREPLTRLLKRTINHVKSFLGEFEKNIKDSRLIVREIHNQSLLSNNQSILLNQDPKMREDGDDDAVISRIEDDLNEETVKLDYAFINTPVVYESPNGRLIVPQRRATNIKPITNIIRPTRFKIDRDLYSKQGLLKTEVFRTTLGVKVNVSSTINQRKLMPQGSTKFLSQELYDPKGNPINPLLFFKGFKIYHNFTKHPKRLIGPAKFQSEEKLYTPIVYSRITIKRNTSTKSKNITKPTKQLTHNITYTNQFKDKIDVNPEIENKVIVFRGIDTSVPTTKRKQIPPHYTLSDFHFRLKEDIFSEPTQQYPDIFLRGVNNKSTRTTKSKSSTKYYPRLFTTEIVTEHIGGVIPEFTKDYLNINFRAQSSDEDEYPKRLLSHNSNSFTNRTSNTEYITKKICDNTFVEDSSKDITSKNVDSTKDISMKIANENLRKIIAPSSYSLSDEETYLKVNLLDQLYHYNKTLNESKVDKT